jgi:uncharacterized membrane protein YGL010W
MRRPSLTTRLRPYVEDYAHSHRTPVNKALHFLGIPLLTVASLGLLSRLALPTGAEVAALEPNAAWAVLLGAGAWYVLLDWRTGLLTLTALAGCYAAGTFLTAGVLAGLFGAGVVAHVVGHYGFEGKPPALLSNPAAVLEAPLWLLATWTGSYRDGGGGAEP